MDSVGALPLWNGLTDDVGSRVTGARPPFCTLWGPKGKTWSLWSLKKLKLSCP